jgi:hypothetical protein
MRSLRRLAVALAVASASLAAAQDAPGPGDDVEVRGVVTPDGRVRAVRIRPR